MDMFLKNGCYQNLSLPKMSHPISCSEYSNKYDKSFFKNTNEDNS